MTALIGTGHSIDQKNNDVKGSFRPEAAVQFGRRAATNLLADLTSSHLIPD